MKSSQGQKNTSEKLKSTNQKIRIKIIINKLLNNTYSIYNKNKRGPIEEKKESILKRGWIGTTL